MNYILENKPTFLLTMLLFIGVTVSCNAQSAETTEEKSKPDTQTTTKVKISINGMTCMACVANVKNTIEDLEGVEKVEVSLEEKQALVTTYVNAKIEPEKIQEAVNKGGFKAGKAEKLQQ